MKKIIVFILSTFLTINSSPLEKGKEVPAFSLIDENGVKHSLFNNDTNKITVLVFYPGDNTPVCTKQLCELRDSYTALQDIDSVLVFGINNNSVESHKDFATKNSFPFPLLIDTDWKIAKEFGVAGGLFGVKRWVFVIGKDGNIIYSHKGKPPVEDIINAIKNSKK